MAAAAGEIMSWPYPNYPEPTPERAAQSEALVVRAMKLVEDAMEQGFVITIRQEPGWPPRMGSHHNIVGIRPKRIES